MSDSSAARTCEGCDACCTVMAVRELPKAAGAPCSHLLGGSRGCGIWGEHPPSCQTFHCLWRHGEAPQQLFPPDCGFLLAAGERGRWPVAVQVVSLPGRRHAWNTPENRKVFSALAATWNGVVTITDSDGRASHAFAPSGRVYSRTLHPEVFPQGGAIVAVPRSDYAAA
ncbi:hypothetical protein [Phenylobacterium sp.]|jgi:hypothetical protein|uniref:hypothetical protein n=1 Tax=Phenylobacterium sp. TaxID=1871053 RepID=UPI002F91F170